MFEKHFQAMSDKASGDGQFYNNFNGVACNQEEHDEEAIRKGLLAERFDSSLKQLDMGVIQREMFNRSRTVMEAINPTLAKQILPETYVKLSKEEEAAICIQKHLRGYLARKLYVDLLYDQYEKEEEERLQKIREQVEEGQLLVENYRLGKEIEHSSCLRKNQRRNMECNVVTIQRAWREHQKKSKSHGSQINYKPEFVAIDPRGSNDQCIQLSIRSNPFDGDVFDDSDDDCSEFNDSLEQVNSCETQQINQCNSSDELYHELKVDTGHFEQDIKTAELMSSPVELPSPTTDWESIESCLTSENDQHDILENNQLPEFPDSRLSGLSLKPNDLQICFVDDALLHETEDEDGYSIKEYIIQKDDSDSESKRDSGCVAGDDETDNSSFSIKTVEPDKLGKNVISQEDTRKILLELHNYEEDGVRKIRQEQAMRGWTIERLQELNVEELRSLHKNMAQCIEAQNEVLVMELVHRDELHLEQDSLLMDVEDSSKLVQAQHKTAQTVKKR